MIPGVHVPVRVAARIALNRGRAEDARVGFAVTRKQIDLLAEILVITDVSFVVVNGIGRRADVVIGEGATKCLIQIQVWIRKRIEYRWAKGEMAEAGTLPFGYAVFVSGLKTVTPKLPLFCARVGTVANCTGWATRRKPS